MHLNIYRLGSVGSSKQEKMPTLKNGVSFWVVGRGGGGAEPAPADGVDKRSKLLL